MAKRALITGVNGQDGGHLAELLHNKGYKVFGIMRGQGEISHPKFQKFKGEFPYVEIILADLTDLPSLVRAVQQAQPDEVYNLAAISHVGYSFRDPVLTYQVTGGGVLNMLEAIRITGGEKTMRFYQASTSEMFGGLDYNRPEHGYDENALFHPRSPYGVAKLYGHWITKNYRENYGMFTSCGILFNHEGPRRGPEFVTRKISIAAARIKLGLQEHLELGNLDSKRDWGFAGDYVEGMQLMLQHDKPDDFVLSTGEAHKIRDFCEAAFNYINKPLEWRGENENEIGIDTTSGKTVIKVNPLFYRPSEVDILLGNPSKAERDLGWKRKVDFEGLVKMMVEHDLGEESA
jgi:GDPmannose 4,6-dehydratase